MKLVESMYEWTPNTDNMDGLSSRGQVRVIRWPDTSAKQGDFCMSAGACMSSMHQMSPVARKAQLGADILTMMIRDRVPIDAIHAAMWAIDEYREMLSEDCPAP